MKNLLPFSLLLCQLIFAQEKLAVPYRQGNLYGLCDTLSNVLVKPAYQEITACKYFYLDWKPTGRFLVNDKGVNKVIDPAGTLMADGSLYDDITIDTDNPLFVITTKAHKYGLIYNGKLVTEPKYDDISGLDNGYAVVELAGKYGVLDTSGKMVVPIELDYIRRYSGGAQQVWKAEKNGNKFEILLPHPADEVTQEMMGLDFIMLREPDFKLQGFKVLNKIFRTDYYIVKQDTNLGLYDRANAKFTIPAAYSELKYLTLKQGHIIFLGTKNGKYTLINETGAKVVPGEYDEAKEYYYLLFLRKKSLWGAYAIEGQYKPLDCKYDFIEHYQSINTGEGNTFAVFKVKKGGIEFYVGENGVEYYRP